MRTRLKLQALVATLLTAAGVHAPSARADHAVCDAAHPWDAEGSPEDLVALANRFAPVILYPADEPNLPTSVDDYLRKSELWFYSEYCHPSHMRAGNLRHALEFQQTVPSCRAEGDMIGVEGTRSIDKRSTFYLRNLSRSEQRGSPDTRRWTTYCHIYRNDLGGFTLQYWRFYAYNTGLFLGIHFDSASHGGDWEAIHVVLAPGNPPVPRQIRLLGHTRITAASWGDAVTDGGHPVITAEKGSHTSHLATRKDIAKRRQMIEQQSWTGGAVRWANGNTGESGPLVIIGQKSCPAPGMEWLQYSGLWGSRESSGVLAYYRSGYWGPAFNETGMRQDGFMSAWCEGIAKPMTDAARVAVRRECYPSRIVQ